MKIKTYDAVCPQEYLSAYGLDPDRVIYFDIETTGFRAASSSLYMIGWAVSAASCRAPSGSGQGQPDEMPDCTRWRVTQIMAQSHGEEPVLLKQFSDLLKDYDAIIEFNGDHFDLPYMKEKYAEYGMDDPFRTLKTVDLYQEIRPWKKALGLDRLNQKSVEEFLRIHRTDPFHGGELIDVYRSVRDHRCPDPEEALHALFLHNYEDILGMMKMTPLLAYSLAMQSSSPASVRVTSEDDQVELDASFPLPAAVPKPLSLDIEDFCSIALSQRTARISIRALSGCLYHFFPDWQNYDYLPFEDTAIHRSISSFVDPSHREKAKARNCYVKKKGVFLPLAGNIETPVFHRYYRDSVRWFEYRPGMEGDSVRFSVYLHELVRAAFS